MSETGGGKEPTPETLYKEGLDAYAKAQYDVAFARWIVSAEAGYPKAMCDVGWLYGQGTGVAKDETRAFEFMRRAAENGYVRAQNNLGLYYNNGTGTPVSYKEALKWLETAQRAGYDKLAVGTLNTCKKKLQEQTQAQAQQRAGGPVGSTKENHTAGMKAFEINDYNGAFANWLSAAEAGLPEAMCDVGWMFSQGYGVDKSLETAFEWMLRAAENNYARAQNNVGLYFKNGTGTPADLAQAVHWLTRAEQANYPKLAKRTLNEARERLALQQKTSSNVSPPNPTQQRPAEAEDKSSRNNPKIRASSGTGAAQQQYADGLDLFSKKQYDEAYKCWLSSAQQGYPKAMCDVGWMLSQGHGTSQDEKAAFEWMLRAAQSGYTRAQNNVGLYYKNGTGCLPDLEKCVEWLEKAEQAQYEKLASKALRDSRQALAGKKKVPATTPLETRQTVAQAELSEQETNYMAFLRIIISGDNPISDLQRSMLGDMRRQSNISDDSHDRILELLGISKAEFEGKSGAAGPARECVICMDGQCTHIILDCMHMCLCGGCAPRAGPGKQTLSCPICREPIKEVRKAYTMY